MESWLMEGRAIDTLLALIGIEAAVLLVARRRMRDVAVSDWLYSLLAGALLLVAMRCALAQLPWQWVGLSLALAGAAHAADLRRRLHR